MNNGIEIIDKIEPISIIFVILFGVAAALCWFASWKWIDTFGPIFIVFAIGFSTAALVGGMENYSNDVKYKVAIGDETNMKQFYIDWEVKEWEGFIFTVTPKSKNAIRLCETH